MAQRALPSSVPTTGGPIARWIGRAAMRLAGWRIEGEFPDASRFVVVVAPHTSNWDFFVLLAAKWTLGIHTLWAGKHSIFRWPVNGFLRGLGGIPVERTSAHGVVQQIVEEFSRRDGMVFTLAPEGTRKRVEKWKSGYWHIARGAGVPIVPVALDYAARVVRLGAMLTVSDSLEEDEARLRAFVATATPKHRENYRA